MFYEIRIERNTKKITSLLGFKNCFTFRTFDKFVVRKEKGELKGLMTEILSRVKRVSHGVNRVSSNRKPAKYTGVFLAVAFFIFCAASYASASDITSQKVIDLANMDRKGKGVPELVENAKLVQAAADKAEDMIRNDYFSHTSPEGLTPWRWIEKAGYDYGYAGENLAMDFVSAEKMNDAWLASPTHRANILNGKYKEIGVAIKDGILNGHATTVVVQMFGSGDKSAPKEKEASGASEKETRPEQGNFVPVLPESLKRTDKIFPASPLITSPQNSEILNGQNIYVVGRANPQSAVTVFDNGVAAGDIASDAEGWFRLEIKNASEGNHDLMAAAENTAAGKKEIRVSGRISLRIDREKPSLGYHLHDNGQDGEYIVHVFSDKKNCFFELGEKKASESSTGAATFFVETGQASIVAAVSDQAGNKTKKQIVLANYFVGDRKNIFNSLALSLAPKTAYAADSGKQTLAKNLGLATEGK